VQVASVRRKCLGYRPGAQESGIRILAISYKKDKALCSPTSAPEFQVGKIRLLSEELRRKLSDGQRQTYSRETFGAN
jgi:hypothetical protein